MTSPFSSKQLEFIVNSTAKWNLAHGSVRCGKTVGTVFRFLQAASECPDSKIYIVGHTFDTAYRNVIRLIMESPEFEIFRPFCNWSGKKLYFRDKIITVLGAKDEGAIGNFQGDTHSLTYCDEITLYPPSIIEMIDTRLSQPWSMGIATMNPSHPKHKVKEWIDKAESGDPNYYSLHFTLDDNPYVPEEYKERLRKSLSGVFYKRNYLGLWCLAEGAIFDFFDTDIHVVDTPPRAADYWVAGIDYGAVNPFSCLLVGVSTGKYTQTGKMMWVEKEYYWDPKVKQRQKTNSEFAKDVKQFLQDYSVKQIYIDPSAAAFKVEMRKMGMPTVDANNEVLDGITMMTNELNRGTLVICKECKNTIREIEGYVWDSKAAEKGKDEPVKKDDHACIVGDTIIWMDGIEGTVKELSELDYDMIENSTIYTFDGKEFTFESFKNPKRTGIKKKILKLTLENGLELRATPDHQVYTKRGYVEIQNLLTDDEILCNI